MRQLHGIILAAGEGTRMKSDTPKVLHPLCGRPMISYAINLAASVGVKQPIVVVGNGADLVKPHLPKEAKMVVQAKRLGTGDAVAVAKRLLGAPAGEVLILYGDTPLLRRTTVQKLIETHFKTSATCTLLTAHLADPSGYGRIVRNETGQVSGVVEEAEANAAQRAIREINVGPLVCHAQALVDALATLSPSATKKELYLTQIISHIAKQEGAKIQTVRVEEVAESLGINSRAELARAVGIIRQRIVETHLNNGVTIDDPQTTSIDHGVTIGADTTIRPHTVIETGVSIGKRCTIGPFARLRSGVAIADSVRVGNFTELVRTKVGSAVRISHVSYLGDAVIEEGANIGAGTITANYDGTQKHQTHIGKGAFIGSDTVLIAPVKIGAQAITGAGSVVPKNHDVPAKGIVVGVPARPIGQDGSRVASGKVEVPVARRAASEAPKRNGRPVKAAKTATRRPVLTKSRRRVRVAPKRIQARRPRRPVKTAKARRKTGAKRR